MRILQVNSSARREGSQSSQLASAIVAGASCQRTPAPRLRCAISRTRRIRSWTTPRCRRCSAPADKHTPEQAARVAQDDTLIAEIQAADVVVLGVPMYNFGVSAQLKNWIDAVTRAKVTFRYTASGPEGLLKGKKVYVALTRGGKYRNTPADTQVPYLKMVLGFLGMTDVQFVYAEGLAMGAEAANEAMASAHQQIDEALAA